MVMSCKCGGEIDFTTGKCKKCKTQSINMAGNASIKIKESDGSSTELVSKKKDENGIKLNINWNEYYIDKIK